jgi:hypothetical protein
MAVSALPEERLRLAAERVAVRRPQLVDRENELLEERSVIVQFVSRTRDRVDHPAQAELS